MPMIGAHRDLVRDTCRPRPTPLTGSVTSSDAAHGPAHALPTPTERSPSSSRTPAAACATPAARRACLGAASRQTPARPARPPDSAGCPWPSDAWPAWPHSSGRSPQRPWCTQSPDSTSPRRAVIATGPLDPGRRAHDPPRHPTADRCEALDDGDGGAGAMVVRWTPRPSLLTGPFACSAARAPCCRPIGQHSGCGVRAAAASSGFPLSRCLW